MNSAPRISVVVPAYDSVAFIGATMDSILAQTFTDFELVVSDHSSTDGTWDVLQSYTADPRVRLHRLPTGGGAPANWNAVSERATGELVKLVCSDDLIYPTCLAEQVAAMDAHPGAVMVACSRDIVDAAGRPLIRGRGLGKLTGRVDGRAAIRATVRAGTNLFGEPASVLLRREALAAAGYWDGEYSYLIDEASYIRVLLQGDLVALPTPLAGFRVSDQQWSVHLMRTQASEAKGYHRTLAAAEPGLLSSADLRIGNAMADLTMLLRRAAYVYLGRRMKSAQT
ncbi:glycosyltransferase family 2 protein [Nakamurella deserti]|uniref:glycosyltransferase family 2 protein n=1 Tax=Nakamurella deserti TaxID=2164074 RepID=UPI000DBE81AB|nr:glycosyltransferase family A protein [Nakamurella deserti]